jgi:hypothetical protein
LFGGCSLGYCLDMRRVIAVLLFLGLASGAGATTIEGVSFPEHFPINGQMLVLNGVGLRTVTLFHVKVYVAGLYLQRQSHSQQEILASRGTKVIVMRFIHAGSKEDVERQYRKGEQENCGAGECDPADAGDFEKLIAAAPAVAPGDTYTYVINDSGLQLYFNNKLVIELANRDLGYRILAGFIGDHPPSPELRQALLGLPAG